MLICRFVLIAAAVVWGWAWAWVEREIGSGQVMSAMGAGDDAAGCFDHQSSLARSAGNFKRHRGIAVEGGAGGGIRQWEWSRVMSAVAVGEC